jgi:aspartyl-tRNA(Asn)/glutamyl-tRNA(Gln) amidotransferase subunit A
MVSTLSDLQTALAAGRTTSGALAEEALARASNPSGEGSRVFTRLYPEAARASAAASDSLRRVGLGRSPLDGVPVSIKDLFDVAGEVTMAGSIAREGEPVAEDDATVVKRLRSAGAVIIGKTNMTEFAYSGLGLNPHHDIPRNPWDRATGRISGGSSSGAAVSVSDGMAAVGIGSDTGGSIRIPAALCGLTGFKPTAARVPLTGALPLSPSLDSIGAIAPSVACCAMVDAILSGEDRPLPEPANLHGLRFAVPTTLALDGLDGDVAGAFAIALSRVSDAGAQVVEIAVPEFGELARINAQGGFTASEGWAWHRGLIERAGDRYDPRVLSRILRGRDMSAADYIDLVAARRAWIAGVERRIRDYDALLLPTVPVVAPPIAELDASDDAYFAANGLILRNPTLINFLNGCALSVPCHAAGQAPVGLMIAGKAGLDRRILAIGLAVEQLRARSEV